MDFHLSDLVDVLKITVAVILGLVGYSILLWAKKGLKRTIRWILPR